MTQSPSTFTIVNSEVLKSIKSQFMKYAGTPFCFVQTSHRSKAYENLNDVVVQAIKKYFNANDYQVLLLASGSAMPSIFFNLLDDQSTVYFYGNGTFSNRYYQQMKKYHKKTQKLQNMSKIHSLLHSGKKQKHVIHFNKIDEGKQINFQLQQQYKTTDLISVQNINYCLPWRQTKPLKDDIVYFESETGFSVPGFTVMMIKKQLVAKLQVRQKCPDMFDYLMMIKMKSVVNTPFTLCTLVLHQTIKSATENKQKIQQKVANAKKIYSKIMKALGLKVCTFSQLKNGQKESFNFLTVQYSERQKQLIQQISQHCCIQQQSRRAYFYMQSENVEPSKFFTSLVTSNNQQQ